MPEYLAPGVYVEEVDSGIKTIEGVSTSIAGMVGATRRGPTVGLPQLVTSFSEFERKYGGFIENPAFVNQRFLPFAAHGFFTNGGRQLYVMRVVNTDAKPAKTTARGGLVTRLKAGQNAAAGVGQKTFIPVSLRGLHPANAAAPVVAASQIKLVMEKEGILYESPVRTVTTIDSATGVVTVDNDLLITPAGPTEFDARFTQVLTDVKGLDATGDVSSMAAVTTTREAAFDITAKDAGSWGHDIVITAAHKTPARTVMDAGGNIGGAAADQTRLRLKSVKGFYVDAWVEIEVQTRRIFRKILSIDGTVIRLAGPFIAGADLANTTNVAVCEFKLTATYNGVTEEYDGLTLEKVPGRYYADEINKSSSMITVTEPPLGTHPIFFPSGNDGLRIPLEVDGVDGTVPTIAQYKGDGDPGSRTGLKALEDIDRISIIAVPGITGVEVQNALIEQCERLKDRFAILDPSASTAALVEVQRKNYDTKYAALYFPRLRVFDPISEQDTTVPPSGHMAGIYARVDIERGVHKPPANEIVRGITGFEVIVNKETQDTLNPSPTNINVFRDFRNDNRGLRIWGARVITSDTAWKYINVRRLFIFLEESLDEGTQWAVFEPNDERLWARIVQSITAFLTRVWRDGALIGATPEEAFFVKCDRTTMTPDDLDNGKLICLVGVAPVKPAEFVIIRIEQLTASAQQA